MLLFLAAGPRASGALWGLALLLAILDAGLFIESAAGRTPVLSMAGGLLSWVVLAVWWRNAGTTVGVLPSLLVVVGLTMIMFAGHAWAARQAAAAAPEEGGPTGFRQGIYLGLVGHLFLFYVAQDVRWALPPWPLLGALLVMTLAATAGSLNVGTPHLHAAGTVAAAMVVMALAMNVPAVWALTALAATEAVVVYAAGSLFVGQFAALELRCARHRRDRYSICRRVRCHCRGARRCRFDPSGGHAGSCRQPFADPLARVAAGLAFGRHGGSRPGVAGDRRLAVGSLGGGRLARHTGVRRSALRAVRRLPADPPSAGAQGSRTVSDGHSGSRLFLLRGPASASRRPAPLGGRDCAGDRRHRAGVHVATTAPPGAGRPARPGPPRAGRCQRAGLCHCRYSGATHQPVDHDRLGPRGSSTRVAVRPCAAQGPALRRKRADGDRLRPPRPQSGGLRLRSPEGASGSSTGISMRT